jgi:hypothetical protein
MQERKTRIRLIVAALCFFTTPAAVRSEQPSLPSEGSSGLVYGTDHAFWVSAPKGWVLDNRSGAPQGLHAVFYRVGSSWSDATTVMYVNTGGLAKGETLESFISGDLARFRERSPNVKMTKESSVSTSDKRTADVRRFSGDEWGNEEAVAYIQEGAVVVMIVLTARNRPDFEAARPALSDLVNSYRFMTKDVRITK